MELFRRHPILCGILVMLAFACLGSYLGQQEAIRECTEIARGIREKDPKDPLDMLWLIGLTIMLIGAAIGALIGIIAGLLVYFGLKRSATNANSGIQSVLNP